MIRTAAVIVLSVGLAACAPGPCPEGKARSNNGACVAVANVFDQFDGQPPAPTKADYLAQQGAIADFNREQGAKEAAERANREAAWEADHRTNRIVQAQKDTQAKLDRIADKLD